MNINRFFKFACIILFLCSLAIQVYVLFFVFLELFTMHRVGFASALGYGASIVFSVPLFLCAVLLAYLKKIDFPLKRLSWIYLASHLLMVILMFSFPGKFA